MLALSDQAEVVESLLLLRIATALLHTRDYLLLAGVVRRRWRQQLRERIFLVQEETELLYGLVELWTDYLHAEVLVAEAAAELIRTRRIVNILPEVILLVE